jgi:hypothetical protein
VHLQRGIRANDERLVHVALRREEVALLQVGHFEAQPADGALHVRVAHQLTDLIVQFAALAQVIRTLQEFLVRASEALALLLAHEQHAFHRVALGRGLDVGDSSADAERDRDQEQPPVRRQLPEDGPEVDRFLWPDVAHQFVFWFWITV